MAPAYSFPGEVICNLAPYSGASGRQPGVTFSRLSYHGEVREIDRLTMAQHGDRISTPSGLGPSGLRDGFTMSYTGGQ